MTKICGGRPHFKRQICSILAFAVAFLAANSNGAKPADWFPEQKLPKEVIRTTDLSKWPKPASLLQVTLGSAAGLAAKAVNEGTYDKLIWVPTTNSDLEKWGRMFFEDHPEVKSDEPLPPWTIIEQLAKKGIIKGYIVYRRNPAEESKTEGIDESINIATSMAGILDGIIVEESLVDDVKKRGLPMLLDARDKTTRWCFETYKEKFNRHMIALLWPALNGPRDYAIANKTFTMYEICPTLTNAMEWVEPPAPVLGWMGGDEFKATSLATAFGHFQTAASQIPNLPVLAAGARNHPVAKVPRLDPKKIDWNDQRSTVSILTSDGDNISFAADSFFGGQNDYFWGNRERGKVPFGWTLPLAHAVQLCPEFIEYAAKTRTPNDWLLEWHGGYYYPDLFANRRSNRWELLGEQASRTSELMKRSGAQIIGYNIRHLDKPEALKALQTIAANTDGLLGILAFQYSPYNAGAGKVLWVKDRRGVDIPVVTLRYQIWWHMGERKNAGTPARTARMITESVKNASAAELPRNDWAMVHVWSYFKKAPGTNEVAEDLPRKLDLQKGEKYESLGGTKGYSPALWCAERLPESIRVVSPDEMIWRIRMKHNSEQTKKIIADYRP